MLTLTLLPQKLSTAARPPEVASWIKRHLNKKHEPITVSTDYASRFEAWWKAIQPLWRIGSGSSLLRDIPVNETWTSLRKGGSAGLYIVVMALSWWIASLRADSDFSRAWALVDDITWVLSLVTPTTPATVFRSTSIKRTSPDTPDEDQSSPAKYVLIYLNLICINMSFLRRARI